jgi:uncharacterized protein YicC (UPF0701 family)
MCLDEALKELIKTKEKEGLVLFKDMKKRLVKIKKSLSEIENNKKNSTKAYE